MQDPIPNPAGLFYTPIKGKAPFQEGFASNPLSLEVAMATPGATGAGNLHQYSKTCSFDMDNLAFLVERAHRIGLDLDPLIDPATNFMIDSPKPNTAKSIYRLPDGVDLDYIKMSDENGCIFELRNGDPSCRMDAWIGAEYHWKKEGGGTEFRGEYYTHVGIDDIPMIPQALLDLWTDLTAMQRRRKKYISKGQSDLTLMNDDRQSVIYNFNMTYSLEEVMSWAGYEEARGKFISPSSSSGVAGVLITDHRDHPWQVAYSFHASDGDMAGEHFDAFELAAALHPECAGLRREDRKNIFSIAASKLLLAIDPKSKEKRRETLEEFNKQAHTRIFKRLSKGIAKQIKRGKQFKPKRITDILNEAVRGFLTHVEIGSLMKLLKSGKAANITDMKAELKAIRLEEGEQADVPMKVAMDTWGTIGTDKLMVVKDGSFWQYGNTHWRRIPDRFLMKAVVELVENKYKEVSSIDGTSKSAFSLLSAKAAVEGDPLGLEEERPAVINCLNGEVWLTGDTAELRVHSPASYLTSVANIHYNPTAEAPYYYKLLEKMFPEDTENMIRHLEELLGYIIQPSRFLKLWLMFYGEGDNGKSILIEVLCEIIGTEAVLAERIHSNFEDKLSNIAGLLGRLIWVDDDMAVATNLPDAILKKVSESKLLTGEFKFKDRFNFKSAAVPVMLTNNLPSCRDTSTGTQTRATVVPFKQQFLKPAECDVNHPYRQRPDLWEYVFQAELAGVLNRWIAGYYRLKARGGLEVPAQCEAAKKEFLEHANNVAQFKAEILVAGSGKIQASIMYRNYQEWCDLNGIDRRYQVSGTSFSARMVSLGMVKKQTDGGLMFYLGVAFKNVERSIYVE